MQTQKQTQTKNQNQALKTLLKNNLKEARRVALLGIGSELRGDDSAGLLVAEGLSRYKTSKKIRFKVFLGGTAPENLTGEIKKFKPTHIILVDSVDARQKPGYIWLVDLSKTKGISFCTHSLPPTVMLDYLSEATKCKTIIIGIQPKSVVFGAAVSLQVKKAAQNLSRILKETLNSLS